MNRVLPALALAAFLAAPAGAHNGPGIGIEDPAPPLRAGPWLKGEPVAAIAPGKVYVIEFWSTWSEPCRESFPQFSGVARKYRDQATVFGVSVFEPANTDADAAAKALADFVARMSNRMDFAVAGDSPRFTMAQSWMWLADEYELPTVFVIDRDARIAWIGNPTNGLDGVVSNVIAGTFDRKAAHEALHAKRELRKQEQDALKRLSDLWRDKKYSEALAAIDRLAMEKPAYRSGLIPFRFNLLLEADEAAAYRYAKELAAGEYQNAPDNLDGMARSICQTPSLQHPDYALALDLAGRACALSTNRNPRHLATKAEVFFRTQDYDRAIDTAQQAIDVAQNQPGAKASLDALQNRLEQFRAARRQAAATNVAEREEKAK